MIFLLYSAVIGSLATGSSVVIGSSFYDVFETRHRQAYTVHPHRRKLRKRPLISIILLAHNNQDLIKSCLGSIVSNTYRNYEIIVVDNASSVNTTKIIKGFMDTNPKKSVKLISKRHSLSRRPAITAGFNKIAGGELVVVLDGFDTLGKNYLKTASRYFALNEAVQVIKANSVPVAYPNVLGITQLFKYFGQVEFNKFFSLIHMNRSKRISSGNIYRNLALKKVLTTKSTVAANFVSDMLIYTKANKSYMDSFNNQSEDQSESLLSNLRQVSFDSLLLGFWSYIIYLALSFKTVFFLALTWAAFSIFMAFALWNSQVIKTDQKLKLSSVVPIIYSLFYVFIIVDLLSLIGNILGRYLKTINRFSRHIQLVSHNR